MYMCNRVNFSLQCTPWGMLWHQFLSRAASGSIAAYYIYTSAHSQRLIKSLKRLTLGQALPGIPLKERNELHIYTYIRMYFYC